MSKGTPMFFNWVQGGDFFELEDKLSLGFGFPALVAVNYSKKKYSVMRSSFETENIKKFISSKKIFFNFIDLLIGKEALKNLPDLPKLKKVDAWVDPESNENKSEDL